MSSEPTEIDPPPIYDSY